MAHGFDILKPSKWNALEQALLAKYFKGSHKEWTKRSLTPLRDTVRATLLKRQAFTCAYCRRALSHEIGHNEIDHIAPKSAAGLAKFTYERNNLVVTCKRCNKIKADHNPLAVPTPAPAAYPTHTNDYIWVHPYFHRYNDHIDIREGLFFEAIGDSLHKTRALAVISQCGLQRLAGVERRKASEKAAHAKDIHLAILSVIGNFPEFSDLEVARAIRRARQNLRKISVIDITELVHEVRAGGLQAYLKSAAKLGL